MPAPFASPTTPRGLVALHHINDCVHMSQTLAVKAKNHTVKTYAVGIVVFSTIVGFFTLLAYFLAHIKVS